MMDSELLRHIDQLINKKLNIILYGSSKDSARLTESIDQMFQGAAKIEDRPTMKPWGLASRAPEGTTQFVGRLGEHFGNRIVLGHFDKDRPECERGETVLYDAFGKQIRMEEDRIRLGSDSSSENAVLGKQIQSILSQALLQCATLASSVVPPNPTVAAALTALKVQVDAGVILSDTVFTE